MRSLTTATAVMMVAALTMAPLATATPLDDGDASFDSADLLLLIGDVTNPKSCSVTADNPTCTFHCAIQDTVKASASNPDGTGVGISGSCGGQTAECSASWSCSDESGKIESGGAGVCELTSGTTGSCAANGFVPALTGAVDGAIHEA